MSEPNHFFIVSEHNPDLVLDIENNSSSQGAKLIVWKYHGGNNQQFKFDDGFIKSCKSGLVLDVENGLKEGANVIQWEKNGGPNQRWRFHKDGTIRAENSNLAIDIVGGSKNEGAKLCAWGVHGGSNQRWRICNKFC